jgi:hypothetical protein
MTGYEAKRAEAVDAAFAKIWEDYCYTAPEATDLLKAKFRTRLERMAEFLLPDEDTDDR